ncbi:hypothetical protein BST36_25475 [Mycolicibacterium moriokaense]|uniref:Uncharacterized protein n=1 Tax=Mycolicibacterium moriokaense TaxID=39691 RepID=A0AAD1HFS7_9MYCO|nr:hypothetical protein [Mycolicibacterium moriokaense]MCV7042875.1 hypothetical protein [Mycolicibacterium moriokaense]ORB16733.1 hypothetical protein BST36_25475 [Mycolicibacterium moriokaense]BBX04573.1 hypothetical protein MMOR_55090 [Mycolicibacterium moriokaense]
MATPEDPEARVAALEASQADCHAVPPAVNALGANQREHSRRVTTVETRLGAVESGLADLRQEVRAGFRSVDEHLAELKDLVIRRINGT